MRLAGISISDGDCQALVDLLLRVGRADDLQLARRISKALEQKAKLFALSRRPNRDLLGILDDPPAKASRNYAERS